MDLSKIWILFLAIALGVSLSLGAFKIFATNARVDQIAATDKCGQIEYQIDKVNAQIWQIEDRYRNPQGDIRHMSPYDAKRYRELLQQVDRWRDWQKKLGCQPGKVGG